MNRRIRVSVEVEFLTNCGEIHTSKFGITQRTQNRYGPRFYAAIEKKVWGEIRRQERGYNKTWRRVTWKLLEPNQQLNLSDSLLGTVRNTESYQAYYH